MLRKRGDDTALQIKVKSAKKQNGLPFLTRSLPVLKDIKYPLLHLNHNSMKIVYHSDIYEKNKGLHWQKKKPYAFKILYGFYRDRNKACHVFIRVGEI